MKPGLLLCHCPPGYLLGQAVKMARGQQVGKFRNCGRHATHHLVAAKTGKDDSIAIELQALRQGGFGTLPDACTWRQASGRAIQAGYPPACPTNINVAPDSATCLLNLGEI